MSWWGSTGHIDSNVPDHQKLLQSRYPSSGWSSTQTGFSGMSGWSQSSSYLNRRNRHSYADPSRLSGGPVSPPYRPAKYGLPSDFTYNSTVTEGIYRNGTLDEDGTSRESGAERSSSYGYMGQEFDLAPYRSNAPHSTDYSSDTGGSYRNRVPHSTDYSSDSGRGHVSHHMTDYSSDSGLNYRHQRRRSSEFDLDVPSPIMTRKERREDIDEALYSSPVKVPPSEFSRVKETIHRSANSHHHSDRSEDFADYRPRHHGRVSPSFPNNKPSDHPRISPRSNQTSDHHDHRPGDSEHLFDNETLNHSRDHSQNSNHLDSSDIDHMLSHDTDHTQSHDTNHLQSHDSNQDHSDGTPQSISSRNSGRRASHDIDNIHSSDTSAKNNEPHVEESDPRPDFMSPPLYRGRSMVSDQVRDSKITKKPPLKAGDLTQWQQRHRSHDTHPDSEDQVPQRGHHQSYESHDHYVRRDLISPRENRAHQLESIRSAADAIIRDKDAIIDDLKRQMVGLEETVKEYENKLRRSLMSRSSDQGESVSFSKMKDLEYRNAQLRTQVANLKLQKEAEIEELEIKLGGVEHEVVQLRAALRKSQPNQAEIVEKLQQKDREIEEWKDKFTGLKESHNGLKEKLDSLERYISDLPAPEEFAKNAEELSALKEENHLKKEEIEQLENRLTEATQQLSDREVTVQELEGKQQHLANRMKDLTKEIHFIKSEGEGRALHQAQEDLQEALEVKDRVTLDLEKAKKLLEINHRKIRQLEVKHQNEVRQVQERLTQEEESVIALREEGRLKEQQIAKLKKTLKEFSGKNQDLMDENLILKDQIKQHEAMSADENQKLQRRFVSEMSLCFSELQSLVQICVQRAEGKDPNISLLLGMGATSLDDEHEGAVGGMKKDEQTLKHWFKKLKELRAEVEKIRKTICNKYAEDMGDNLNCATQ